MGISPAHMCLLPSSQTGLCGGHQASSRNMCIYRVPLWLSPFQNLLVKFLGSLQVCDLPPLVQYSQATKTTGFSARSFKSKSALQQ